MAKSNIVYCATHFTQGANCSFSAKEKNDKKNYALDNNNRKACLIGSAPLFILRTA